MSEKSISQNRPTLPEQPVSRKGPLCPKSLFLKIGPFGLNSLYLIICLLCRNSLYPMTDPVCFYLTIGLLYMIGLDLLVSHDMHTMYSVPELQYVPVPRKGPLWHNPRTKEEVRGLAAVLGNMTEDCSCSCFFCCSLVPSETGKQP